MTDQTITPYETEAEAQEAHLRLLATHRQRLLAVRTYLESPEAQAYQAKVGEMIASGLPVGTTRSNLGRLQSALVTLTPGLDTEIQSLDAQLAPPPQTPIITPITPTPFPPVD